MALFYGDQSRPLWNWINRRNGRTWSFLYSVGVWLQNKEWKIRHWRDKKANLSKR